MEGSTSVRSWLRCYRCWSQNLEVQVHYEGIHKIDPETGEEDIANLVLRLAISQMIAERAGQAFSLLILDEVFGSLDETRRHNVVELLRRLHDRFEQVIVITHMESVRDGLDRVIAVRYDEEHGTSVVEPGSAALPEGPDVVVARDVLEHAVTGVLASPAA